MIKKGEGEMKRETIVKLIMRKLGLDRLFAELVADDMIRDDFPKNGIKTMGGVITYLDYVQSIRAN